MTVIGTAVASWGAGRATGAATPIAARSWVGTTTGMRPADRDAELSRARMAVLTWDRTVQPCGATMGAARRGRAAAITAGRPIPGATADTTTSSEIGATSRPATPSTSTKTTSISIAAIGRIFAAGIVTRT